MIETFMVGSYEDIHEISSLCLNSCTHKCHRTYTDLCSCRYSLGRLRRWRNLSTILFLPTPWLPTRSRCSPSKKSFNMSSITDMCWNAQEVIQMNHKNIANIEYWNQIVLTWCQRIPRQTISHATGTDWVFFVGPIICTTIIRNHFSLFYF